MEQQVDVIERMGRELAELRRIIDDPIALIERGLWLLQQQGLIGVLPPQP